jgi:hypothetical protein
MELPKAVHQHSLYADCEVTYRLLVGSLVAERRLTVLQAKVPMAEMKSYADWYEACGAGRVPYLQLVKVSAASAGAGPSSPTQMR